MDNPLNWYRETSKGRKFYQKAGPSLLVTVRKAFLITKTGGLTFNSE